MFFPFAVRNTSIQSHSHQQSYCSLWPLYLPPGFECFGWVGKTFGDASPLPANDNFWYRMKSCWSLSFGGVCTMHCLRLRKVTFEPVDAIQKRIEDVVRVQSDKTDPEELRQSHFMSHLSFKAFGSLANERMWKNMKDISCCDGTSCKLA